MPDMGIIWLWTELDAMFPNRWIARMGLVACDGEIAPTAQTWKRGLHGLKREWVQKAILKLSESNTGFIPELPEFRALCLQFKPIEYFQKQPDNYQYLPAEQAKEKFDALKKILGGDL